MNIIDIDTKRDLDKLLALNANGNEQDWEIELADKYRIEEFIEILSNALLSNKHKYGIAALILASYEDYLGDSIDPDNAIWHKIFNILNGDINLYRPLLEYWNVNGEDDEENMFNITGLIRDHFDWSKN